MNSVDKIYEYTVPAISAEFIARFAQATRTQFALQCPTLGTVFRDAEYRLLNELGLDLNNLLHSEQEFVYHAPLKLGVELHIKSKVVEFRERRTKDFIFRIIGFETEVSALKKLCVVSRTGFVIRDPLEGV